MTKITEQKLAKWPILKIAQVHSNFTQWLGVMQCPFQYHWVSGRRFLTLSRTYINGNITVIDFTAYRVFNEVERVNVWREVSGGGWRGQSFSLSKLADNVVCVRQEANGSRSKRWTNYGELGTFIMVSDGDWCNEWLSWRRMVIAVGNDYHGDWWWLL